MNKLSNVEAQRVMAVLGEMLDRLNYLSYIPEEKTGELLDLLKEHRCDTVANLMEKQWHLEQVHEALQDVKTEESLKRKLINVRNLCRELRENPIAVEALYHSFQEKRSSCLIELVQTLSEVTDLTYNRLVSTVEDDSSKQNVMSGLKHRKKNAEEDLGILQDNLNQIRKVKDEQVSTLEVQAHKLKNEIQDITQNSMYELGLIETEMKEVLEKFHKEHSIVITTLKEQAALLEQKILQVTLDHREHEALLRKRKRKVAREVENLVDRYDEEMTCRESKITELNQLYKREQEKFAELKEYFLKIDEEQERIAQEEILLAALRDKELQEENKLSDAATKIQKIFRGGLARQELKKTSAKGKKGKKGKKK